MSNMSYCRFHNTADDLADCESALEDLINGELEKLSRQELYAAKRLVTHCQNILQMLVKADGATLEAVMHDDLGDQLDFLNNATENSADGERN